MVHFWPRAARATRRVAVDAVGVGQSKVVAHGIPEADLVQLEFWLARQTVQEGACGRRRTGCDSGLGLGTNPWVSHEALVVVLLHDKGKGTLELKTGRPREVGDVGEKSSSVRLSLRLRVGTFVVLLACC